ncbi:MAG TPA: response regulator [Chloroflexota bacterium]|nr:response regulator [Chloroflexota bacterium]
MQEQAAELGRADFLNSLEQVRAAGRGLLAWLAATLDLGKVAAGELDAARIMTEPRAPVLDILARCAQLRSDALAQGWNDAVADIGKIESASHSLLDSMGRVADLSDFDLAEGVVQSLPVERSLALQAMARARAAVQADPEGNTDAPRVLIVDATEAERDLLSRRLVRLGYRVSVTADGFEALRIVRAEQYDVVLLDVMLPEMDGSAVLEELKRDEQLRDLPVIMLSALDQIEWVTQCIELGAEDYLPKPFEPMVLQARIEASLEKRRLRLKEVEYLREVARVTEAAMAVEAASFDAASLDGVALREDGLGHLARVFQRMAREVQAREEQLRRQVLELRIEIDTVKRNQEVKKITDTAYFRELRKRAQALRDDR